MGEKTGSIYAIPLSAKQNQRLILRSRRMPWLCKLVMQPLYERNSNST